MLETKSPSLNQVYLFFQDYGEFVFIIIIQSITSVNSRLHVFGVFFVVGGGGALFL